MAVDSLARLHAEWWKHPRLDDLDRILEDGPTRRRFLGIESRVPNFLDYLGDRLSPERRDLYDRVAARLPKPRTGPATLLHGDAHFGNVFLPNIPSSDPLYLIDWQFWDIGPGPRDLAFMIALHWYPERRRRMELDLVKRYHDGLQTHGVVGYDWDSCWTDYRTGVIENLLIPVWSWSLGLSTQAWWSNLERAMSAFEDLDCEELLDS